MEVLSVAPSYGEADQYYVGEGSPGDGEDMEDYEGEAVMCVLCALAAAGSCEHKSRCIIALC
jgi:hypothetical protein